jgi:nucleotide-binding universal stress UspA family protein
MLRLLIAIDGSPQSLRAIEVVGRWARGGAPLEVVLINVRPPPSLDADLPPAHADALQAARRRAQERILRDAESRALGCGVSVRSTVAVEGAPAQEIVRAATAQVADEIVMGAHGTDAVGGGSLVPGSVAQRVLCLAKHPVLLIP